VSDPTVEEVKARLRDIADSEVAGSGLARDALAVIESLEAQISRHFNCTPKQWHEYNHENERLRARLSGIEFAASKNDRITLRVIARRLEATNALSANIAELINDGQFLRRLADDLDQALTEGEAK
jgi:hypothetical protein